MNSYKASPVSRDYLRRFADQVRRRFLIDPTKAVDVLWLLEAVFPTVFAPLGFSYEIWDKDEMGDMHGLTSPINNTIYIREDVYDKAARGVGRDRMTIMHELAHYLLHDGVLVGLARRDNGESIPTFCDPEWQATAFAAELLMPANQIRHMTVQQIVETYGVSRQAAEYQLRTVNK